MPTMMSTTLAPLLLIPLATAAHAASPAPAADAVSTRPTPGAAAAQEVRSLRPRLLVAHEQGLTALDALTGRELSKVSLPRFLRLANAGDGRHVMVTDSATFRVYDLGLLAQRHGDHHHYFATTPRMTDVTYAAPHAGHVVVHDGRTTLFADGTGQIQVVSSARIADKRAPVQRFRTAAAHHGVALMLRDGSLLTTQGDAKQRSTVQVLARGRVRAQTTNCPGVHGETVARPTKGGDVVALGCENGPVVYRDGAFQKVPVKDAYARSGNLFGHESSPIILADYKVKKGVPERPTRVALIDTARLRLDLLDIGSPYWFRSFARGPRGEGLVLGYDGRLRVIDVQRRSVVRSIPVISAWQEKTDWQEPGPAVKVAGGYAYVTDAQRRQVAVVDLNKPRVTARYTMPATPVEIAVVTGFPEAPAHRAGTAEHTGHHAGEDTGHHRHH